MLADVLDRTLAKDPAHRLQDGGQLRAALHLARNAIADGQGDEPLPELPATAAAAVPAPSGRGGAGPETRRPGSSILSGTRNRPRRASSRPPQPVAPPPPVRWPMYAGGIVVLAAIVAGGLFLLGREGPATQATTPPPTAPRAQVDRLAQELVGSQIELARRRMNAGDYRGAAREAERAVKLDPANAEAQTLFERAKKIADDADSAAELARAAAASGPPGAAAEGLWKVLVIDPAHPAVDELAPSHEATFKARADEARRLMNEQKAAAEKANGTNLDPYREATTLARDGEAGYKAGRYVTAARKLVQARDRYERASRFAR